MRKHFLFVAFLGATFGLAISASAQVGGVRAKVPFDFAVSDKIFPAGEYTMVAASEQIRIEDAKGKPVAMVLANQVSGRSAGATGQIVFQCYRNRCFLRELWSPVQQNGRQLLTSRAESELKKEQSGKYFAVLGQKPQN